MSLPSCAIYYNKQDEEIHREFVNVGWYVNEDNWVACASVLPIVVDAVTIKLYGVTFLASYSVLYHRNKKYKTKLLKIYREADREFRKQEPQEYTQKQKELNELNGDMVSALFPMMRRGIIPSTIASEIIGVQPMSSYHGQVFNLKHIDSSSNWYKVKTEFNKWIVFIKSIVNWYKK